MANQEQLEFLKKGVETWNRWRKRNPEIKADLSDANLSSNDLAGYNLTSALLTRANLVDTKLTSAYLSGTDLTETDLRYAQCDYAELVGANLFSARLSKANFSGADLTDANLTGSVDLVSVNFTKANLTGANLTNSDLHRANLHRANLRRTIFTGAFFADTILSDVDLSEGEGLEKVHHLEPSAISISTIQKSKGRIPLEFLRGCGLSDLEIESAKLANPDLSEKEITDITYKIHALRSSGLPIRYNSVFISYSFRDQEFATQLHDDLQNNGVRCWFAPHDIQGGKKIHEQIDAAIRTHDRLFLILSENSMHSEWVKTEIANARQKEIEEKRQVLFPLSLVDYQKFKSWKNFDADTGKDSAREIREYFIPDFSRWQDPAAYEPTFKRLLQDLKT